MVATPPDPRPEEVSEARALEEPEELEAMDSLSLRKRSPSNSLQASSVTFAAGSTEPEVLTFIRSNVKKCG